MQHDRRLLFVGTVAAFVTVMLLISRSGIVRPVNELTRGNNIRDSGLNLGLRAWIPNGAHIDTSFWHESSPPTMQNMSETPYYGQDVEDQYAYETFFTGVKGGTYLELGALDGAAFSNTRFFAEQLGWKGVLIEPNAHEYQSLIVNRPRDFCVNAAICASSMQVHFSEKWGVGGIYEFMSADFIEQWHSDAKVDDLPVVMCLPLASVLAKTGLRHINFFSLDVENAELEVLLTINFSLVKFDVIVVEADGRNNTKDEAVRKLLQDEGYSFHDHVVRNDWFTRASMTT